MPYGQSFQQIGWAGGLGCACLVFLLAGCGVATAVLSPSPVPPTAVPVGGSPTAAPPLPLPTTALPTPPTTPYVWPTMPTRPRTPLPTPSPTMEPGTIHIVRREVEGIPEFPLWQVTETAGGLTFVRWLDQETLEVGVFTQEIKMFTYFTTAIVDLTTEEVWLPGDVSIGDRSQVGHHPDGTRLVYVAEGSVFIADRDGGNRRLLATGTCGRGMWGVRIDLVFSPDGRWLALGDCTGVRVLDVEAGEEIYAHTTEPYLVAAPAWSPEGHSLAFFADFALDKDDEGEYVTLLTPIVMDITTGREWELPVMSCYGHEFECQGTILHWFGDGQSLLVEANELWIADTSRQQVDPLPGSDRVGRAVVSPAGDRVAYTDWEERTSYVYNPFSGQILTMSVVLDHAVWSLSSDRLLVLGTEWDESNERRDWHFIFNVNTGERVDLALPNSDVQTISWSPDGRWVANISWSKEGLWLIDSLTSQQIQIAPAGARCGFDFDCDPSPQWSPDGRWIAFIWRDNELYLVDLANLGE